MNCISCPKKLYKNDGINVVTLIHKNISMSKSNSIQSNLRVQECTQAIRCQFKISEDRGMHLEQTKFITNKTRDKL